MVDTSIRDKIRNANNFYGYIGLSLDLEHAAIAALAGGYGLSVRDVATTLTTLGKISRPIGVGASVGLGVAYPF